MKLEIFDGSKTYSFPNGELATPDVMRKKFSSIDAFPFVLEIGGNTIYSVGELSALLERAGIDPAGKSQAEQLEALQQSKDAEKAKQAELLRTYVDPKAKRNELLERIAIALEKLGAK
jgi:hypothetical protein